MRDAAMATAQAQPEPAAACAAAPGELPSYQRRPQGAGKRKRIPIDRPAESLPIIYEGDARDEHLAAQGKEAMRLIGEMWSKLPEAEKAKLEPEMSLT